MRHPQRRAFLIGSIGYPALELLYRGRTHWTMALAGGCSLFLLRRIRSRYKNRPLWQQALRGGLYITGLEYLLGRKFNAKYRIWDYRNVPWNLQGQICLPYTLFWCGLSAAVLSLMRKN